MASDDLCEHIQSIHQLKFPKHAECEECMKTGDTWVHLRTCQTCGATRLLAESACQQTCEHFRSSGSLLGRAGRTMVVLLSGSGDRELLKHRSPVVWKLRSDSSSRRCYAAQNPAPRQWRLLKF
jgi:hypothetical protein